MGEIADMMLDGTMCAGCGEWLHEGEDGDGFPGYCSGCAPDYDESPTPARTSSRKPSKTVPCPHCKRKVHDAFALTQHIAAKHGGGA